MNYVMEVTAYGQSLAQVPKEKPQSCLWGLNQGASTIHFYLYMGWCPDSLG
jgi:hypothetical protein